MCLTMEFSSSEFLVRLSGLLDSWFGVSMSTFAIGVLIAIFSMVLYVFLCIWWFWPEINRESIAANHAAADQLANDGRRHIPKKEAQR